MFLKIQSKFQSSCFYPILNIQKQNSAQRLPQTPISNKLLLSGTPAHSKETNKTSQQRHCEDPTVGAHINMFRQGQLLRCDPLPLCFRQSAALQAISVHYATSADKLSCQAVHFYQNFSCVCMEVYARIYKSHSPYQNITFTTTISSLLFL